MLSALFLSMVALVPRPAALTETGGALEFPDSVEFPPAAVAWTEDASLPREGYRLVVSSNGVTAAASSAAGRFYALQTLRQLAVRKGEDRVGIEVPCVRIEDAPRFGWRGVHLDESRHFFGKASVKKLLELMAYCKFNVLHWHLTDNPGWRLQIDRYPALVRVGSQRPIPEPFCLRDTASSGTYGPYFYTKDDVREILAYAAERQVEIVPEFDFPGHCAAVLRSHPELFCGGHGPYVPGPETPERRIYGELCPGKDATVEFVRNVLDEIAALFPSKYVHIGGDECERKGWATCPDCNRRMRELGLKDGGALQGWLTKVCTEHLARLGKRAVTWYEPLEGCPVPGSLVMSWRDAGAGAKEALAAGCDLVMSAHRFCYFDYKNGEGWANDPCVYPDWTPVLPLAKVYAYDPLEGIPAEHRSRVLGTQCENWTERTCSEAELEWKMWPRALAKAENAWTAPGRLDYADFLRRAKIRRAVLVRDFGVNAAPVEGAE